MQHENQTHVDKMTAEIIKLAHDEKEKLKTSMRDSHWPDERRHCKVQDAWTHTAPFSTLISELLDGGPSHIQQLLRSQNITSPTVSTEFENDWRMTSGTLPIETVETALHGLTYERTETRGTQTDILYSLHGNGVDHYEVPVQLRVEKRNVRLQKGLPLSRSREFVPKALNVNKTVRNVRLQFGCPLRGFKEAETQDNSNQAEINPQTREFEDKGVQSEGYELVEDIPSMSFDDSIENQKLSESISPTKVQRYRHEPAPKKCQKLHHRNVKVQKGTGYLLLPSIAVQVSLSSPEVLIIDDIPNDNLEANHHTREQSVQTFESGFNGTWNELENTVDLIPENTLIKAGLLTKTISTQSSVIDIVHDESSFCKNYSGVGTQIQVKKVSTSTQCIREENISSKKEKDSQLEDKVVANPLQPATLQSEPSESLMNFTESKQNYAQLSRQSKETASQTQMLVAVTQAAVTTAKTY